jgi:hypothetical protein
MSLSKSLTRGFSAAQLFSCLGQPVFHLVNRLVKLLARIGIILPGVAAHALVNRCEHRGWDAENVKHCDKSISQRQTRASDCLVAARAYQDSLVAVCHATMAMELANKSNVFHQRHLGKSANVQEDSSPAEYAVIAASHSQQNACVMRKAIRESIN